MPRATSFRVFFLSVIVAAGFFIGVIPDVLQAGAFCASATVFCVGFAATQLIARTTQGHWMWPPSNQFPQFIYGDLIALPLAAAGLGSVVSHWDGYTHWIRSESPWRDICVFIAVLAVIGMRSFESKQKPPFGYEENQRFGPAKLYHDFVPIPVLVAFFLMGLPSLWHISWAWHDGLWATVLIFLGITSWVLLALGAKGHHFRHAHPPHTWGAKKEQLIP